MNLNDSDNYLTDCIVKESFISLKGKLSPTQSVGYLFAGIASYLLSHVPNRGRDRQGREKGNKILVSQHST